MIDERYLFILGRTPLLSLAELQGYAASMGSPAVIEDVVAASVAIVRGKLSDYHLLMEHVAGTVKVASVAETRGSVTSLDDWVALLFPLLQQGGTSSLTFGLSFYGQSHDRPSAKDQERIALTLKRQLKATTNHIRWVSGRGQPLTSVQVEKNELLTSSGVELIVLCTPTQVVVGQTKAVQLFEEWGERDYGRPRRNAKQGMLPPKLARMMVNMLGLSPQGTLLDPFCGSGTVLAEAALMGWTRLIGSDSAASAVVDTKTNIEWLREQSDFSGTLTMFQFRIEGLVKKIKPGSITVIVTEPFLGRPFTHPPRERELAEVVRTLQPLYLTSLSVFAELLAPGGRAVFLLPHWYTSPERHQELSGVLDHLPRALKLYPLLPSALSRGQPLLYHRPGQYVGREIVAVERLE